MDGVCNGYSPMRNDTRVVPYNVTFLTGYALYRGAIRRECPAFHLSPVNN